MTYPPEIRREFLDRLADSWWHLADHLEVPPAHQRCWRQGDEPRELWQWLAVRKRLADLPQALEAVDRQDLADLLETVSSPPESGRPVPAGLSPPQLRAMVADLQTRLHAVERDVTDGNERLTVAEQALDGLRAELQRRERQLADSDQQRVESDRQRDALASELTSTVGRLLDAEQQVTVERQRAEREQARTTAANRVASDEAATHREERATRQQQAAVERGRADRAEAHSAGLGVDVAALTERLRVFEDREAPVAAVAVPTDGRPRRPAGVSVAGIEADPAPTAAGSGEPGGQRPARLTDHWGGLCRVLNHLYAQRRGPGRWIRRVDRLLASSADRSDVEQLEQEIRRCRDAKLRALRARDHARATRRSTHLRMGMHQHVRAGGDERILCRCNLRWCRPCRRATVELRVDDPLISRLRWGRVAGTVLVILLLVLVLWTVIHR